MWLAVAARGFFVTTMSHRTRLALLLIAVLIPALGAPSWLVYRGWVRAEAAQERQAQDSQRALALLIERELGQPLALARALAASASLDRGPALSEADRASWAQSARRATAGTPAAVQLLGEGVLWLDTRQPGEAPRRRDGPGQALRPQPGIELVPAGSGGGDAYLVLVEPVRRGTEPPALNVRVLLPLSHLQALWAPALPWGAGGVLDAQGRPLWWQPGAENPLREAVLPGLLRTGLAGRDEGRLSVQTAQGEALGLYFSRSSGGWISASVWPSARQRAQLAHAALREAAVAWLLLALAVLAALWLGRTELRRRVGDAIRRTQRSERWAAQRERTAALGRLTGRVAHEFNNLLGIISNSAHLIHRHADSPALSMPVAATLRAVEGASRLTQHLLRFGGQQAAQPRTVALGEWLPELREMLTVVLGKRIELGIHVPEAPLYIRADPDELELALINLALNARDVLPEGGRVSITAGLASSAMRGELPAGPYVFITVRDDGPGLDAAQARHAFEPFFTTKDGEPEAGFGLSQVHGFCVQAGGRALIASQPQQGTSVSLVLPAVGPDTAPPLRSRPPPPGQITARVLLTEDNAALSDVTAALIEDMGGRVERATHAAQALQRLERGPAVDVVLTDVSMPGEMDGLGLARAVRARWPRVRVVLISAYGKGLVGAENFTVLTKPCAPQALLAALRGALGTPHAP